MCLAVALRATQLSCRPTCPQCRELATFITDVLGRSSLTRKETIRELASNVKLARLPQDAIALRQGAAAKVYYIVLDGILGVFVNDSADPSGGSLGRCAACAGLLPTIAMRVIVFARSNLPRALITPSVLPGLC